MQVWRICRSKYAHNPFSGEGGIKAAARWHHAGHRIVYTSATLSLAAWEAWVHKPSRPLSTYVSISAQMPDDLDREEIEEAALISGWRDYAPYPSSLADLGTAWLMRCSSPILQVPSALIAGEFNYLLNPVHRDFPRIQQGRAIPFEFPRAWEIEHMR